MDDPEVENVLRQVDEIRFLAEKQREQRRIRSINRTNKLVDKLSDPKVSFALFQTRSFQGMTHISWSKFPFTNGKVRSP